jgi:1-acyl-sn-glycerol-3-phosphate acyltransferase
MTTTAFLRTFSRLGYGVYSWSALVVLGLPALVLVIVLPGRTFRRGSTRFFARLFFLAIGSPVRVVGAAQMPAAACVVVANHASYLDGIVLTAALPPSFTFVIKHEMARFPFAGLLLRRIGSEFVNRADDGHKKQVARRLFKAARAGDALAFFPEGTFTAEPGLRPFKPGAFRAAWKSRVPLVPIVIHGARAKLPAQQWLPKPGRLAIEVRAPLDPTDYESPASLMAATRAALLECLEEPDLG